ncbi:U3 small nucleolar RNA-associated protein 14, partial [Lecanoromycetidae sp. Uapishka_2]
MPGRQSTGPPSTKRIIPKKQKGKRSFNALAIAAAQNPVRAKIRQSRLGQAESESSKRKRKDDNEDEDHDDSYGQLKRRKAGERDRYGNEIELGSDSSGNEWTVGKVDDDDDSDLDSDEAMGESDEEKFEGFAFGGSIGAQSSKKHFPKTEDEEIGAEGLHDIDLREDGDENVIFEDESDSLGDDAVDLAEILDASEGDEGESRSSGVSENPGNDDGRSRESGGDTDDDSFEKDESILSLSGDEQDAEESEKLASLQLIMSTLHGQDEKSPRARGPVDAQESMMPSDLPLSSKRKLTAADLMTSKVDAGLRKAVKLLADNHLKKPSMRNGVSNTNDVPLPKRQQDRIDRAAAYEKSKETLSRWIDTVKHNRRAEHLSFPLKDPSAAVALGTQQLLPKSQALPFTDLESTIQTILQASGLAAPQGKSEEDQVQAFEELQTRKMPLEEVQARRAELRRARELLFREEMRQHRINKIKSKTYRKVHRKERERIAQQEKDALTAAGVDNSESEQERNDRRRAEERMGARHRESRWAKGVKDSGRAKWDDDARGGVTEMAKRGEELRRRIEGKRVAGDEEELSPSESESGNEDDIRDRLQSLAREHDESGSNTRASRLANMDFMKRADAARKAQNDEDLQRLRRDEAGEDTPSEEEAEEGLGRKTFGPTRNKPLLPETPMAEQRSEFEERQDSDLEHGNGNERPEEDLEIIVDTSATQNGFQPAKKSSLLSRQKQIAPQIENTQDAKAGGNPWLTSTKKGSSVGKKRSQDPHAGAIILNSLPAEPAAPHSENHAQKPRSALKGSRDAEKARQAAPKPKIVHQTETSQRNNAVLVADGDHSEDAEDDTDKLPFVLRNQDLIRKAFAGDEVVADFNKEKLDTAQDEDEKTIDNTLPGWGSWTGAGIGKKAQKRNKNKVLTKEPGVAKDKRQDAKLERVIINEKRVKKNGKYLASSLPHPFETRQQYERSLRLPVGPEWTTKETFQGATKPRILMKQGVIRPMAKPMI